MVLINLNFDPSLHIIFPIVVVIRRETKAVFVLDENHFRKCISGNEAIWLVRKIIFSENWNLLTQKKCLWPRKSFYTSIFPSKYFRKILQRERERAREPARSDDRRRDREPAQSDDRRRTPSSSLCRSRSRRQTFQSPLIAISPSRDRTGSRSRLMARSREDRDLAVDRDLTFVRSH